MTSAPTASYKIPLKKYGLKQIQKGDIKITFTIAAKDMPAELFMAPIGQTFEVEFFPVNDNQTPTPPVKISESPPPEKPPNYCAMAKMLIKSPRFCEYICYYIKCPYTKDDLDEAQLFLYAEIGIQSSTTIKKGSPEAQRLIWFKHNYEHWFKKNHKIEMEPTP